MKRHLRSAPAALAALAVWALAALAAALLTGCLLDKPLINARSAYDPRTALKGDSLERFDTVEIRLVDPDDPSVSILLWKGPPSATDSLPAHLAGDGRTLVYLVHGYRIDRGRCFTERVSQDGDASVIADSCGKPIPDKPKPGQTPYFLTDTVRFWDADTVTTLQIGNLPDTGSINGAFSASEPWFSAEIPAGATGRIRNVKVSASRKGLATGTYQGKLTFTLIGADGNTSIRIPVSLEVAKSVPRFPVDSVDFGETDTVRSLSIVGIPSTGAFVPTFTAPPWVHVTEKSAGGGKSLNLTAQKGSLALGLNVGSLTMSVDGLPIDTVTLLITVPKPTTAGLSGILTEWGAKGAQAGFAVMLDGAEPGILSDADGRFAFPGVALGSHTLSIMATGRIGRVDTITLDEAKPYQRDYALAPSGAFATINIDWKRPTGQTAIAAGRALLASADFDKMGSVAAYPLDNPSTSLIRFVAEGNTDGNPDLPEFFEAGEIAADSSDLFIAYPEDSRLGRIRNWTAASETLTVRLPFQPGGLLLDGSRLLALGRAADGTLVLGALNTTDLSLIRVDTLSGFHWDGVKPDQRTPKLVAGDGAFYAVDGNSPNEKGHVLKLGGTPLRVEASKELPDAIINGLAIHDGLIYVTSMSSSGKTIRVFDRDLSQTGSIAAGMNTGRIAFAEEGLLRGYGFVATDSNAVLVIHPMAKKPVGRLALPGLLPARSLSVDGRTGTVLVSDGDKLHSVRF